MLFCIASYLLYAVVDQLPRLRKRELVFLLLFTCSFVEVSLPLGTWDGLRVFTVALPGYSVNYFPKQLQKIRKYRKYIEEKAT